MGAHHHHHQRKAGRVSLDGAALFTTTAAAPGCSSCPFDPSTAAAATAAAAAAPSAAAAATAPGPTVECCLLDALPECVLLGGVLPRLAAADRRALRAASRRGRLAANAAVTRARVTACDLLPADAPGAAAPRLGARFPSLSALEVADAADAAACDDALVAFLGGAGGGNNDCAVDAESAAMLARLEAVDVKRAHYVGPRLLRFLRARCPSLRALAASRWTDSVMLRAVAGLAGLEALDLSEADAVDDAGLGALAALPALRALSLARCRWVGDAGCRALAALATLEDVSLAGTDAGPEGLAALAALPRLRRLDLSGCRRVGDAAVAALALASSASSPPAARLEALELRNTEVHADGLRALAALPALKCLDLGSRFELDDAGVEALAGCAALRSLTVGSFVLSRPPPRGFGVRLEALAFGGGFANRGLEHLFPLPRLRALAASGVDAVTDRVLRSVASQASLEELTLRSGYALTRAGLEAAVRALPRLSALRVASCPAVPDALVAEVLSMVGDSGGGNGNAAACCGGERCDGGRCCGAPCCDGGLGAAPALVVSA